MEIHPGDRPSCLQFCESALACDDWGKVAIDRPQIKHFSFLLREANKGLKMAWISAFLNSDGNSSFRVHETFP